MTLPVFDEFSIPLNKTQSNAIIDFHELVYANRIKLKSIHNCFCGSINFDILSRCDRFGLPFGTQICKECGLITQTVQIHPDSMPLFYETIYWPLVIGEKISRSSQNDFVTFPKNDETSSFILKSINSKEKELKIFEVGCGSGFRIKRLKEELNLMGHEVQAFGCDYSSEALKQAKRNEIEVIHGGFDEIRTFGKADVLVLSHVFEHLPDLNLALEQINTITHDASVIYIEVPGVNDLENKAEYSYNYQVYCVLAHTYNFSLRSLTTVMSSGGFRLLEGDEYVRSIFVKGGAQKELCSAYETTIYALEKAYKKSTALYAKRNNSFYLYFKNLAKAILARN